MIYLKDCPVYACLNLEAPRRGVDGAKLQRLGARRGNHEGLQLSKLT